MSAKQYVRVVNWETYQHYKDRNPPWIKLHNALLEDPAVAALSDAMKAHLFGVWLLASRLDNRIPADAGFIGKRINATVKVDLKVLISLGFLEPHPNGLHDASGPLAGCTTETEERQSRGETEQRQRQRQMTSTAASSADTPKNKAAIDAYNATLKPSKAISYGPGNLRAAARAYAFGYTLEQMQRVFEAVRDSETDTAKWCHENNREFEYLVRPEHKHWRTHEPTPGRIDVILNELATGRRSA
jgi:hypothetical protein